MVGLDLSDPVNGRKPCKIGFSYTGVSLESSILIYVVVLAVFEFASENASSPGEIMSVKWAEIFGFGI
jgi:hypothetical protein